MSEKIKAGKLFREMTFDRAAVNTDARTVDLAFSSEQPVERWFGSEILDHSTSSVRLGRLMDGGPLLMDHNGRDQVGVVESVEIGADRIGRAKVRFGRSARAEEVYQDVLDGIRSKISVGYMVHKMQLDGKSGDDEIYRATDWEPLEVSIVSIPADASVGIGRAAAGDEYEIEIIRPQAEERKIMDHVETPAAAPAAAPVIDTRAIENDVRSKELKRINDLEALGNQFAKQGGVDLARKHIAEGKNVGDLQAAILERVGTKLTETSGDIGLSDKEVRQFSFTRAINALANPTDKAAQAAAAFEREVSEVAARAAGKSAQGILVPAEVLRRDLNVGTATAGGNLVATDLLAGSFIDLLRNRAVAIRAGAQTMNGLVGNIAIPKQTGAATAYWVAESGAPTESQQTVGQVTMSPKTVGAYTDFSRRLMLQSSIDVENMVRNDLALVIALAIDAAAFYGTASNNQPRGLKNQSGINTVDPAAATPTFAEVVAMESAVAADNADVGNMAYVVNAAMRGALKSALKFSAAGSDTIWEAGNTVNGYRTEVSNQIEANDLFFGNFADLMIGFWSGLDLMVDPYSNSTSGTVRVVALQDCDIAVRRAESFCYANTALT
jgi:HK97 family phage major capsid protein